MFSFFKRSSAQPEIEVTIANRTVIRVVGLVVIAFILLSAIRSALHELILIFTAFFLTLALNGPVHWIGRHMPGRLRGSRTLATTISFLIVILILGGFLATITPPLIKQSRAFISAAPKLANSARDSNGTVGKLVARYHLEGRVSTFSHQLSQRLNNLGSQAFSTLTKIGSSAFSMLTILVLTFMMLIEGPRWIAFFDELVPEERRKAVRKTRADMYRVVQGYVNGQVILAALASLLITPALVALHVSYAIALVVVIFFCGLIPLVGHTIGAIIVTLVALAHSFSSAAFILAYYIIYQQIENYIIQPRIQANSTEMSPLIVFMSVILGVSFGGLVGALVAIPVAGCIRILLLGYLSSHNYLADKPVVQQEVQKAEA